MVDCVKYTALNTSWNHVQSVDLLKFVDDIDNDVKYIFIRPVKSPL